MMRIGSESALRNFPMHDLVIALIFLGIVIAPALLATRPNLHKKKSL